jgi:hypothetical protein
MSKGKLPDELLSYVRTEGVRVGKKKIILVDVVARSCYEINLGT